MRTTFFLDFDSLLFFRCKNTDKNGKTRKRRIWRRKNPVSDKEVLQERQLLLKRCFHSKVSCAAEHVVLIYPSIVSQLRSLCHVNYPGTAMKTFNCIFHQGNQYSKYLQVVTLCVMLAFADKDVLVNSRDIEGIKIGDLIEIHRETPPNAP